MITIDGDNSLFLYNFFGNQLHEEVRFATMDAAKENIPITPYAILQANDIISVSNLSCQSVRSSIEKYPIQIQTLGSVQLMSLEFIKAYDEIKNDEFLSTAAYLTNACRKFKPDSLESELNEYQILRRQGKLSQEVGYRLIELKNANSENALVCAAICSILDNELEFELFYNKLSPQEKEKSLSFPVFYFAKNWIAVISDE